MKGDRYVSVCMAAHEAVDRTCKDTRLPGIFAPIAPANIGWVFDFPKVFFGHFIDVIRECLDDK